MEVDAQLLPAAGRDGLRARVRGHLHRARRLSACGRAEKVELVVLWEELLVVGRLEWKKNTLSDLPPTPVLLARATALATEVIRHLHLVPKDHSRHLLRPPAPTPCQVPARPLAHATHIVSRRGAHRHAGCLRRSGRRARQRSAPASRKSACSPPASSLSSEPARAASSVHGQVLSAERWGGTRRVGRGEGLEE
jgi:hypothetical protein